MSLSQDEIQRFEAFYGNYQKPLVPDALDKNKDGEYKHYFTRDALAIWQAANAIQSHSGGEAVGRIERNSSSKYTFIFNDEYIGEGKLLADGTELYLANPDQIVRIKEQQAEITRLTALVESYKETIEILENIVDSENLEIKRKLYDEHCQCSACIDGNLHSSDCAVHNMPAYKNGDCDCGTIDAAMKGKD